MKSLNVFFFFNLIVLFFLIFKYEPTRLEFSGGYKYSFKSIDFVLKIGTLLMTLASIVTAILININFNRFKVVLIGLMILSGVYVILATMHSQFQIGRAHV